MTYNVKLLTKPFQKSEKDLFLSAAKLIIIAMKNLKFYVLVQLICLIIHALFATAGIPQSSNRGHLLFYFFINDSFDLLLEFLDKKLVTFHLHVFL